jgi:hypothetical protein
MNTASFSYFCYFGTPSVSFRIEFTHFNTTVCERVLNISLSQKVYMLTACTYFSFAYSPLPEAIGLYHSSGGSSRALLATAVSQVLSQVKCYGIYGGRSVTEVVFLSSNSVSPASFHSTNFSILIKRPALDAIQSRYCHVIQPVTTLYSSLLRAH